MIEHRFGLRKIYVTPAVDNIDSFSGVGVIEAEVMFLAGWRASRQAGADDGRC